jgi:hypothetical protein
MLVIVTGDLVFVDQNVSAPSPTPLPSSC